MNNLIKTFEFEGTNVETVVVNDNLMFEVYSTGMALGYVSKAKGHLYPHKIRIDKILENAEITTVVQGVQQYITEEQLYDFMLESKTEKCKLFRKWVVNEVLPSIRKTGGYGMVSFEDMMIKQLEQMKLIKQQNIKNSDDIRDLRENSPLYNIECDEISKAVRKKGTECLGGKNSNAYKNKSARSRVYSDIYSELRRNFDVGSYKAIKRKSYETALKIIKSYKLPIALEEIITQLNGQASQYTIESWVNS